MKFKLWFRSNDRFAMCASVMMLLLTGCGTLMTRDYSAPDLPQAQLARIEGSRHVLAGPQIGRINVDLKSIDGLRVVSNSAQVAPGDHTVEAVIHWGGATGPAAARYSETKRLQIEVQPDRKYKIKAALHSDKLLNRDPTRYWWVEDVKTGAVIAGEKAPVTN